VVPVKVLEAPEVQTTLAPERRACPEVVTSRTVTLMAKNVNTIEALTVCPLPMVNDPELPDPNPEALPVQLKLN
jgi:hypothetical protein